MGPYVVTGFNPDNLKIETRLNGKNRAVLQYERSAFQGPSIDQLHSRYITLLPGDLIATGTTGRSRPHPERGCGRGGDRGDRYLEEPRLVSPAGRLKRLFSSGAIQGSGNTAGRFMQCMVLEEFKAPLVLRERAFPRPDRGEAVIQVGACGLCRTDLRIWSGGHPR